MKAQWSGHGTEGELGDFPLPPLPFGLDRVGPEGQVPFPPFLGGAQDTKKKRQTRKGPTETLRQVRQVRQPIKFNKTANRMLVLCLSHLSRLVSTEASIPKTTAKLAGFVLVSLVSVVSASPTESATPWVPCPCSSPSPAPC